VRYTGTNMKWIDSPNKITDAIVDGNRIRIDWIEDRNIKGSLEAFSDEQLNYTGFFGYTPEPENQFRVEFTRFDSKDGQILLLGKWWDTKDGGSGPWLIRLQPMK
jgi:hypothetical protein